MPAEMELAELRAACDAQRLAFLQRLAQLAEERNALRSRLVASEAELARLRRPFWGRLKAYAMGEE